VKLRHLFLFGLLGAAFASLVNRQKQYLEYMTAVEGDLENPQNEVKETDNLKAIDNATPISLEYAANEVIMKTVLTQELERKGHFLMMHPKLEDCYLCTLGPQFSFGGQKAQHSISKMDDKTLHVFEGEENPQEDEELE
jgi:hypothetical protein